MVQVIVACDDVPEITVAGQSLTPVRHEKGSIPKQWRVELPVQYWAGMVSGVVSVDGEDPEVFAVKVMPSSAKGGERAFLGMIEAVSSFHAALPWGFSPGCLPCPEDASSRILPVRVALAVGLGGQIVAQAETVLRNPPTAWQQQGVKRLDKAMLDPRDLPIVAASPCLAMQLHATRRLSRPSGRPPQFKGGLAPAPALDLYLMAGYLDQAWTFIADTREQLKSLGLKDKVSSAHGKLQQESCSQLVGALQSLRKRLPPLTAGAAPTAAAPSDANVAAIGSLVRRMRTSGAALDKQASATVADKIEVGLRPSFDLFELYCMIWCMRQIGSRLPGWRCEAPAWDPDGGPLPAADYVWHKPDGSGVTARLGFQKEFVAYAPAAPAAWEAGVGSLSIRGIPDLVLAVFDGDRLRRWGLIDAKFRSRLDSVHKALADIHVYRDGLRWQGKTAEGALILVPGLDEHAQVFAAPDYRDTHKFGAVVVVPTSTIVADAAARAVLDMLIGTDL